MNSGFKVICQSCKNEVILKSKRDDYMGFTGSDIYSSNTALIYFSNDNRTASIVCKCGNTIWDC